MQIYVISQSDEGLSCLKEIFLEKPERPEILEIPEIPERSEGVRKGD